MRSSSTHYLLNQTGRKLQSLWHPLTDPHKLIYIFTSPSRLPRSLILILVVSSRFLSSDSDSCLSLRFLLCHPDTYLFIHQISYILFQIPAFSYRFLHYHQNSCIPIKISTFSSRFLASHPHFCLLIQLPAFTSRLILFVV